MKRIGCSSGCKQNFWVLFVLLIFFIAGTIPVFIQLGDLASKLTQVDESEVYVTPITEQDTSSLLDKLNACGLTDLSVNLNEDTYTNNTQILTQDLVLTSNELGALLNHLIFNDIIYIGELNITTNEVTNLEFKLRIDAYKLLNNTILQNLILYCNISLDIEKIENKFNAIKLESYIYGYDEETNDVLDVTEQSQDILAFFNGTEEFKGFAETIGASSIDFENGVFIARCVPASSL